MRTMFDPFITLVRGWHVYARQSVVFAGVSLSCLFMTVLALDSVSVGECLPLVSGEHLCGCLPLVSGWGMGLRGTVSPPSIWNDVWVSVG